MVLPSTTYKRTLFTEADMLASGPENENNYMAYVHVATIDTVTHSSSSNRLDIPQPQEWVQIREVLTIDIILSTLVVACRSDNSCRDDKLADKRLAFKANPIIAKVALMSSVFDPEVFCDLIDD